MRIAHAPQTRIPPIIQPTVLDAHPPQKRPHLRVPPVNHGMHPHETRPPAVRLIESCQAPAVWVGAPRADEDGANGGVVGEVVREGQAHGGVVVVLQGEAVVRGRGGDESINGGEGVSGGDVNCGEEGGEVRVGGEEGEVEDQKDEAVFAAVVGEGEGGETVERESVSN